MFVQLSYGNGMEIKMSEIILTDSAARSASDIAGVKDVAPTRPEGESEDVLCVADGVKETELSVTGSIETTSNDVERAVDPLEAEFDELIRGRFSEVYKKRTEKIIRKRLRSGKAHPDSTPTSSENVEGEAQKSESSLQQKTANESVQINTDLKPDNTAAPNIQGYESARQLNKNRPIENGLSGSSGMVTKINVSALDGKGVLSIIKRVGTGEKISFK